MTNYQAMCQAFADKVDFNGKSPVKAPKGSPFNAAQLSAVVKSTGPMMPKAYITSFAGPLLQHMPTLTQGLKTDFDNSVQNGTKRADAMADVQSIADTLVGAVSDWSEDAYRGPLQRFEAVISNLYRSFLSKEQRASVGLPLIETVPPLVTFAPTAAQGPFTLPSDSVKDMIQVPIGVVSLPGSYREHPLLWPALAHECGGHDVLHADPGLLKELGDGVMQLPHLPGGVGRLWSSWMDEAASDVYGLLNVGPAFAISLAAFFCALRASGPGGGGGRLGAISNVLPVQNNTPVDVHPVDLLRLHLAFGAVSQLSSLSATTKSQWLTALDDLANQAAAGATTIDVVDVVAKAVSQQLPIGPMADAARAVGGFIVTARLQALGGHSIQDIETWDDLDEKASQTIRQACHTNGSLLGLGDDAQLLAGTTLALFDDATKYDAITRLLDDALDDSFNRDPVFAPPAPRHMFVRKNRPPVGKGFGRSPTFPIFPLEHAEPRSV
jgi:hypothetical protein